MHVQYKKSEGEAKDEKRELGVGLAWSACEGDRIIVISVEFILHQLCFSAGIRVT